MRKLFCLLAVAASAFVTSSIVSAEDAPKVETPLQKVNYGLGYTYGMNLRSDGLEIDIKALVAGLNDAMAGNELKITEAEFRAAFAAVQQEMQKKSVAQAAINKEAGAKFLAENAKKPGVVITDSGLQYKVVQAGTGATPKGTDTVRAHYRGRLIDGTEFDSSYKRNQPLEFQVDGGVIKGWAEALKLMKVGAKWELYIPSELAYRDQARGAVIGPNSVLTFEIELVEIVPPALPTP